MKYPNEWPKPNPLRPSSLRTRITEQQKEDLYLRKITTRKLARQLNVAEKYLSVMYPGKEPIYNKRPLIEARREFRAELAKKILEGQYTTAQAADLACVSNNTMYRALHVARVTHPDLAVEFNKRLSETRRVTVKKARDVRKSICKLI